MCSIIQTTSSLASVFYQFLKIFFSHENSEKWRATRLRIAGRCRNPSLFRAATAPLGLLGGLGCHRFLRLLGSLAFVIHPCLDS